MLRARGRRPSRGHCLRAYGRHLRWEGGRCNMAKDGSDRGAIACLLADDFEDSELRVPYDRLRAAGYAVEIIGRQAGEQLEGEHGRESVLTDLGIDDADVDDYE